MFNLKNIHLFITYVLKEIMRIMYDIKDYVFITSYVHYICIYLLTFMKLLEIMNKN